MVLNNLWGTSSQTIVGITHNSVSIFVPILSKLFMGLFFLLDKTQPGLLTDVYIVVKTIY